MPTTGSHDSLLVTLSVLIATVASYTALDLAGRIHAAHGWAKHAWLATAAFAMGGGIWSMHFVAMLAFRMPDMAVDYNPGLTEISFALPILATGGGFYVVNRQDTGFKALALSGLFMGLGIAGMHYTDMAAMLMPADLSYDGLWVAASVLIAIGASTVALWLAFRNTGLLQKVIAAIAMGIAVSGMHYAAMQGAIFTAHSMVDEALGHASLGQTIHAPITPQALATAPGSPVLCYDADRDAVSVASGEGKSRCRMHGGAKGSGAPNGSANGSYRHGMFTCEAIESRRKMRALIAELKSFSQELLSR